MEDLEAQMATLFSEAMTIKYSVDDHKSFARKNFDALGHANPQITQDLNNQHAQFDKRLIRHHARIVKLSKSFF